MKRESSIPENQSKLPVFEDDSVLVAQHRKQHLVLQLLLDRIPIDIEHPGMDRGRSVLQNVVPHRVALLDPHVVGNEIENLSQLPGAQSRADSSEPLVGTALR